MKLILNRREGQKKGIFSTTTVYYLDVTLETTPEEMALIKKHQWEQMPFCEGMMLSGAVMDFSLNYFLGRTTDMPFKAAEQLAYVESQIIENAKKLKQQLEAAASFTSGGPREIEL